MKIVKLILASLLIPLCVSAAAAPAQLMEDGNKAFQEKKYNQAALNYLSVIREGYESSALYFNLGNAYFKMDSLPQAILYYEKARQLNPGDEDILFNLRIVNAKIVDKIDVLPELFYVRYWNQIRSYFSRDQWAIAGITGMVIFFVLAGIYLLNRRPVIRKFAFWTGVVAFVFVVFSVVFSWQSHSNLEREKEAVVFEDAVMVKSSPDKGSMDIFVVHAGTKVKVEDQVGDWLKIVIANGSVGWVESVTLRMI